MPAGFWDANVSGMMLFADGGVFASKPYAPGDRYIDKMSNYYQSCVFNQQKKLVNTHAHLITFIGHFWFSTALGFPIIQEWQ